MELVVEVAKAMVEAGVCLTLDGCIQVVKELGEHQLRFLAHGYGIDAPPVDIFKLIEEENRLNENK